MKYLKNFVLYILTCGYLITLIIFPYEVYMYGYYSEILPAFDIITVYYFSTYRKIEINRLFIAGLMIDPFFNMPTGVNSLIFISGEFLLRYLNKGFSLNEYVTNLLIFTLYAFLIILLRAIAANIFNFYNFEGYGIYFYFLTTILAYPLLNSIHRTIKLC